MSGKRREEVPPKVGKSHAQVISMFRHAGRLTLSPVVNAPGEQVLSIEIEHDDDRPCVYLWIDEAAVGGPEILYVGMTRLGLRVRQRRHRQGSMGKGRGRVTGRRLRRLIEEGARISIRVMHPEPARLDDDVVPIHAAVEEFLLASIEPKPILNREGWRSPRLAELDAPASG